MLNAISQVQRDDTGEFAVIDEQTGEKTHFPLKKKSHQRRKTSARAGKRPRTARS